MADYRMSFTTGGLFLPESRAVAMLRHSGESWSQTLERAELEGIVAFQKASSNRRFLREIVIRLSSLTGEELEFLAEDADHIETQVLLWIAVCRAYRLVEEFSRDVIVERYLTYRLYLPVESFVSFLDAKAEWSDELAGLSTSSRVKLRQVLFRMMREAGIISKEHLIQAAIISKRLTTMVEASRPQDLELLPGVMRGKS